MNSGTTYRHPLWLCGGHAQTLYTALFVKGPDVSLRRERWEWPDGDFVDADWLDAEDDNAPVVILFHGLEASSDSTYARALMSALKQRKWRGVVPHFRGCSGEPNRLPRGYFAGDTAEIERMLNRVAEQFPNAHRFAIGFSLGGNAMLKWLGDAGAEAGKLIKAAASVSAPLDMQAAGLVMDRGFNRRIYTSHFLSTLKPKALDKAKRFPGCVDADAISRATTFREFDTLFTARMHGYQDAEDYWLRTSSKPALKRIAIPTLVLNARNDPFLPAKALPVQAEVSSHVVLEQPAQGGHVAFPTGPFPGKFDWLPKRLLDFIDGTHKTQEPGLVG